MEWLGSASSQAPSHPSRRAPALLVVTVLVTGGQSVGPVMASAEKFQP